jgi:sugar lactone lactonase YvrE
MTDGEEPVSDVSRADLVLPAETIVGESVIWDDRDEALYCVDIVGRAIHSLHPGSGSHQLWVTPDIVTSIGLRRAGGMIVGLRKAVVFWEPGGDFVPFAEIEPDLPSNRLNEGVVGPDGALWLGTMENNIAEDGSPLPINGANGKIVRLASDATVSVLSEDRFGITNTFAWTSDGRLITADTIRNEIYSYRIDHDPLKLSDRRTILAGFGRGLPDGSCMDSEGYLWNCRVAGGSAVIRLSAEGRVDRVVDLPCSWPTSCCFGGPDLATLYVTSARFTMSADHLAQNPQEGGLFSLDAGVAGCPSHRFG